MRLLLVEDNPADARLVTAELSTDSREPVEIDWVDRLAAAVTRVEVDKYDVCLLDLSLPDAFGAMAVQGIRKAAPDLPVVILTGYDDHRTATAMLREGGQDYLIKGSVDGHDLLRAIQYAAERQRLGTELRHSRSRFADFARSSSDWYWETDAELRFTWFSERFQQMTGIDPVSLIGRRCDDSLLAVPEYSPCRAALRDHQPFRDCELSCLASGVPVYFHVAGVPVVDQQGRFRGYRGTGADVTRLKEAERALEDSRMAAEQANRAKSAFLAQMSHELRTPLNAILGFAEIIHHQLLGPVGTAKYLEYAADIHASGEHLLTLINDVLDMSKVEAGKRPLELESVNLAEVVHEAQVLVSANAAERQIELATVLPAAAARLTADRRAVKQCLLNLLSNAVKFTPPGGRVTTATACVHGRFEVSVQDTGIGIPPKELPRLLRPFEQVDNPYTRRQTGTGLGLALTRTLVEMHGGSIAITAPPEGGTRVTLAFPVRPAPRPADRRAAGDGGR